MVLGSLLLAEIIILIYLLWPLFYSPISLTQSRIPPTTIKIINVFEHKGMHPIPIAQKIRRPLFYPEGIIVCLAGDNIQIFEYPDYLITQQNLGILRQKYKHNSTTPLSKNTVHIYTIENSIIFYMGINQDILSILDTFFHTTSSPQTSMDK